MINEETLEIDGKKFIKHSSDKYMIEQVETGVIYESAIDLVPCAYTYKETEQLKPVEEKPVELEAESGLTITE